MSSASTFASRACGALSSCATTSGSTPSGLTFQTADVLALTAAELGAFDVVLCLGLIYHVEHPMGVLRLARELTRGLCVVESQTARVETPALFGFGARDAFEATDAVLAIHHEADQATNPLASQGGALSFCPNPAALRLMTAAAGFGDIHRAEPGDGHDPDFHTGDRAVLFARPGSSPARPWGSRRRRHPRPEVDAEHRPNLADEQRLAAEDLAPLLDEALRLAGRLDVLDEPAVDALGVQRRAGLDHAFERLAGRAHALDGLDLARRR